MLIRGHAITSNANGNDRCYNNSWFRLGSAKKWKFFCFEAYLKKRSKWMLFFFCFYRDFFAYFELWVSLGELFFGFHKGFNSFSKCRLQFSWSDNPVYSKDKASHSNQKSKTTGGDIFKNLCSVVKCKFFDVLCQFWRTCWLGKCSSDCRQHFEIFLSLPMTN